MNNYIFLTDEGYTYQPNSESDMPDIENLQVIGISNGETEREAFYDLMSRRKYILKTTFDKIFCYRLCNNYENSHKEFSIKDDYADDMNFLLNKIKEDMNFDINECRMVLNALFDITRKDLLIVKDIIINEYYCNYYLYVHDYYELSVWLYDDDGLWENKEQHKSLYEFLSKAHNEPELKKRLKEEGWFISGGFAICLDNNIINEIVRRT